MAKKFGTTWWGEKWLDSLTHIDYGNRLPRGARYARNGSVKSIDIKNGMITAKVAGSRPTPYKETISVPQFDKTKVKAFLNSLTGHPIILAALLQRRLDPEVLKIADECGLKVFPTSWKDLGMKCSCPDWAVPCKHLAAVIYKVSEEIDNNPFLVFELHGLDLLEELKRRGLLTDLDSQKLDPLPIQDILPVGDTTKDGASQWKSSDPDLSRLPAIGNDLLELLHDNPPFSIDGDFKKTYTKSLTAIGKSTAKRLNTSMAEEERIIEFEAETEIGFKINKSFDTEVILTTPEKKPTTITFAEFERRLGSVNSSAYTIHQPWLESMHRMWLLAANLLARKLVVPLIVSLGKTYRILWQPALLHPEIRGIVKSVTDTVPGIVSMSGKHTVENSGEWLLSNMLNAMIADVGEIQNSDSSLYDLFFLDEPQSFNKIGQQGVPGGIKVWTDKFFLLNEEHRFLLVVKEKGQRFMVDLHITPESKDTVSVNIPYSDFISNPDYETKHMSVMSELALLTDYMPGLRDYIIDGGKHAMTFDARSFVPFLFSTLPLMRLLGVDIALPKSLQELITPKVSVKIDRKATGDSKTYVRLDELLTFSWEISLGETLVSVDEFRDMMIKAGELIKFKGRYIYVTPEELEKLSRQLTKTDKLSPQEVLAIALSERYKDAPVALTSACRDLLDQFRKMPDLPLPEGLNADLRPYQIRGYEWMMHNLSLGFGSIIADDMGLGKTLQVIAVLLQLKESGRLNKRKVLVVVPTGLLVNWQKECARFAPELTVSIYHGAMRDIARFDGDILLTSYGVMRSDAGKLKKLKWELIVIDEAQNIKNTSTAQTKAINSISASSHIAMSGTPVENRLSEYWSIMNFTNKGLLGTLKDFNTTYGRPIQLEGSKDAIERFKAVTAPFMLRRLKSDKSIISDLPDKIERDEYAALTPDQSALYQQTLNEAMREIEGIEGTDHASLFKREGLVLQMIMALKQICNHPAQFLKTKQADAELSGKTMMLMDRVEEIVNNGEKVLIFTQFKEMGDLIAKMLERRNIASMFYHGGTTLKKRTEMVDRFQTMRSAQVFILSLKAAGTGLNLTAATNVIHFDLWWNPAVEAQATDRAYRIGQHNNVQVYRFITKGTFEEKINDMIQDKKQLADLTVGTGEKWLAAMSDSELRSIFSLDAK